MLSRAAVLRACVLSLRQPLVRAASAASRRQAVGGVRPIAAVQSRLFHRSVTAREEVTVTLPRPAESISEGEVSKIEKAVGDAVGQDEAVVIVETDKTSVSVSSPGAGVVTAILVAEGETVQVGAPIFKVNIGATGGAAPKKAAEAPKKAAEAPKPAAEAPKKAAAPAPEAPKKADAPKEAAKPKAEAATTVAASTGGSRGETREKMSRMRIRTAERLKESQNVAAMLTTFNEIDMSNLMDMRNTYKDDILKKYDVKLGFMSAFCKAAACALKEQPVVNAYMDGKEIVYHDYVDISVAVASPKGLVVPVLRNVETMSFVQIEKELASLSKKARDGNLAIEEMDGGTFTISNGGVFGSLMGTPIINPPQTAILGMHGIFDRPIAHKGQVVIRPMMYVALTYDHRLIDGREAVTFLRRIKSAVEDPRNMLLD